MAESEGLANKPILFPNAPPPGMDEATWRYMRDVLIKIDDKAGASITAQGDMGGGQNLLTVDAGPEHSGATEEAYVYLNDVTVDTLGITPGDDVLSFGGYVRNDDGTSGAHFRLVFKDSGGAELSSWSSPIKRLASNQRTILENIDVPSNADTVRFFLRRADGSGTVTGLKAVLNIGPFALRFSEAPIRSSREDLDDIKDGDDFHRVLQTQVGAGVILRSKNDNLAQNPVFGDEEQTGFARDTKLLDEGSWIIDGWKIFQNETVSTPTGPTPAFGFTITTADSLFAGQSMEIQSEPTIEIPANTTIAGAADQIEVPAKQDDVLFYGGSVKLEGVTSLPAGIDVIARISLLVRDPDDNDLQFSTAKSHTANTSGWEQDFTSVHQTNANTSKMALRLELLLENTTASPIELAFGEFASARFDGLVLARQIRDPRQQYPLGGWNRTDGFPDSEVLSASDAGASATISIASHNRESGFGTVVFPSGSITGLAFSTEYDVYADLPDYDTGTVTYQASTDLLIAVQDADRVYLGRITTPSDGGGGTVGGIETCLEIHQYAGQVQVKDLTEGDPLTVMNDAGDLLEGMVVKAGHEMDAQCIELVAENGESVICSETTPVILTDGRWVGALGTRGLQVYGKDRMPVRIKTVRPVGVKQVRRISVGGHSFFGGTEQNTGIYTHNQQAKP